MQRTPRKLTPHRFLLACLSLVTQGLTSLRQQAVLIGLLGHCTISKQAVHRRLGPAAAGFLRAVLAQVLARAVAHTPAATHRFGRLLVQDSTCWSLPPRLRQFFPGPANAQGRGAAVRVQSLYDLRREQFLHFALSAFTRNDQAASADVLALLRPADLVLRDLGYFSSRVFAQIAAAGAFFLSRLRYGVALYLPGSDRPVHLLRRLRPGQPLDLRMELGPQRLPVRILAFPLPTELVNERRRKARADRDRRLHHSPEYYQLLAWNIFITNAPSTRLSFAEAIQIYRLRWRIEIIFKSWKSYLGLQAFGPIGPRQVEPLLYGLLILAVLLHADWARLSAARGTRSQRALSLPRVAALFALFSQLLLLAHLPRANLLATFRRQMHSHCRYESRRRRSYAHAKRLAVG